MLLHTRQADVGLSTGVVTREIARSSRLVSRLTGYPVQPNKAIVGRNAFAHESGIHQDGDPQGALDLRDHGRDHGGAGRQPARARQALRPPRAARGAGGAGLPGRRPGAEHRLQALQGARGQEEAGHRDGPRGARHRRAARGVAPPTRCSGSTSRPPRAGRRTRPSACARPTARSSRARSPATARSTRSSAPSTPRPGSTRACASSASTRSPAARTRSARSPVVVELGQNAGERVGLPGVLLRERATGAGQAVTTDIIEAAGMAYARALTNAVRRMQSQAAEDGGARPTELATP